MVSRKEYLEGEKVRLEEILKRDLTLAQRGATEREYKGVLLSLGLLKPEEVFAITPAKIPERLPAEEVVVEAPKVFVYRVLPSAPPVLHDEGLRLYQMLDDALFIKDTELVLDILRKMLVTHNSPLVVLGIALTVKGVLAAIVAVLGSKAFSSFMIEETLQSVDFAIYQASQNKDWEAEAELLAKKKEILDMTPWEQLISWIPSVNLIDSVKKYVEVSRLKLGIDEKLWKERAPATSVNKNVSLDLAAAAIEKGEDPSQYLPTTESTTITEVLSGEVISVVDGDTIEIKSLSGEVYRVRLLGIDAPEFNTIAGKESGKFLTDLIHGKTVTIEVDPNAQRDTYGRILGRILYNDVDINKKMLLEGMAQPYFIGENKYVDVEGYKAAATQKGRVSVTSKPTYSKIFIDQVDTHKLTAETFDLKEGSYVFGAVKEGYRAESQIVVVEKDVPKEVRFELTASTLGEEETIEEVTEEVRVQIPGPPVEEKFTIEITSTPTNAKLFIDDVYTGHWTPSNERELRDVIELLSPGEHLIKVSKAGQEAEKKIMVLSGANPSFHLTLETVGLPALPPVEEAVAEVPPEVEVPKTIEALFEDMTELTVGRTVITRREVQDLKDKYGVL